MVQEVVKQVPDQMAQLVGSVAQQVCTTAGVGGCGTLGGSYTFAGGGGALGGGHTAPTLDAEVANDVVVVPCAWCANDSGDDIEETAEVPQAEHADVVG